MLVLSRREDEVIRIGDDITIKVVTTSKAKVRLGITAPSEVPVHREEVYQRNQNTIGDVVAFDISGGHRG